MLESEASTKICPHLQAPIDKNGVVWHLKCAASGCMMWAWETPEYNYLSGRRNHTESRYFTLQERLELNPDKPKDGWKKREDGYLGWQRPIPQEQRHGSCGLANLNMFIERE